GVSQNPRWTRRGEDARNHPPRECTRSDGRRARLGVLRPIPGVSGGLPAGEAGSRESACPPRVWLRCAGEGGHRVRRKPGMFPSRLSFGRWALMIIAISTVLWWLLVQLFFAIRQLLQ